MRGSFIEDLLPTRVVRTFDLVRLPEPRRHVTSVDQPGAGKFGQCEWVHEVRVTPGAEVVLRAGDAPIVTLGRCGEGPVVAVTGTVLGQPPQPFWRQALWTHELTRLVAWAAEPSPGK